MRECEIIEELNKRLLNENASRAMDQDEFKRKYDSYVERYEKEVAKIEQLQRTKEERQKKAEQLSAFMFELHERDGLLTEFDEKLWVTMIDKVVINHNGSMVFRFNNGMEVVK